MTVMIGFALVIFLTVGLAGYGALLFGAGSSLRAHRDRLGLSTAAGLCLYLLLCTLLESGELGAPWLGTAFLTVGTLLWGWQWGASIRQRGPTLPPREPISRSFSTSVILLPPILIGLLLVANAAWWEYSNVDDVQGYLVYIQRVLQTGSTGPDPFAYRRFESGLGGNSYVYALGAMLGDATRLRIIDIGGGFVVLASLIAGDLTERACPPHMVAIALGILVVAVAFAPSVNMTPEIIGMAMLYAMARLCWILVEGDERWLRAIVVGLFVFGLVCLKTTFLVPAAGLATATYLTLLLREQRRWLVLIEAAIAAAIALLFMAPWMAISQKTVGTPLFPVLGVGRLSPLEASGHASLIDFLKSGGRIAILLALPLWVSVRALEPPIGRRNLFLGIALPLCAALFLIAQAKYSVAGYRYGYAGAAALFLFSLVTWLGGSASPMERRLAWLLSPVPIASLALYLILVPGYRADTFSGGFIYRWLRGDGEAPALLADRTATRRMQAAVPPGAVLLVRIDRPFQLDFSRNKIFVMDWPGLTGPVRPIPTSASARAWRDYLRTSSVDFVAYSYGDEAGMPSAYIRSQIAKSDSAFLRDQLGRTASTQAALVALRRSAKIVFDDGRTFVADIRSSAT